MLCYIVLGCLPTCSFHVSGSGGDVEKSRHPHLVDQVYPLALGGGHGLHNPGATLPQVCVAEVPVFSRQDEACGDEVKQLHPKLPLHSLDVHVQTILSGELR